MLRAALSCFAESGFEGTSLRMIATRAIRPLSLLSHHFGSKEGLYREVFQWMMAAPWRSHAWAAMPQEGYVPRDRNEAVRLLREQIHALYHDATGGSASADPLFEHASGLLLREIRSPRACLRPLLAQYLAPRIGTLRNCIRLLRPDLPEAEAAFIGSSIMGEAVAHGLMRGTNQLGWGDAGHLESPFHAAEVLVDLCLNGLMAGSRA